MFRVVLEQILEMVWTIKVMKHLLVSRGEGVVMPALQTPAKTRVTSMLSWSKMASLTRGVLF
jgi:hypothetical protein